MLDLIHQLTPSCIHGELEGKQSGSWATYRLCSPSLNYPAFKPHLVGACEPLGAPGDLEYLYHCF